MSLRTLKEYEESLKNVKQCEVIEEDRRNTQMCWFILRGQECPHNDCRFAHTMDEHITPESYKTVFCKNYQQNGFCPFFEKCRFIHRKGRLTNKQKEKLKKNPNFKTIPCRLGDKCPYGDDCGFLHDPGKIREYNMKQNMKKCFAIINKTYCKSQYFHMIGEPSFKDSNKYLGVTSIVRLDYLTNPYHTGYLVGTGWNRMNVKQIKKIV